MRKQSNPTLVIIYSKLIPDSVVSLPGIGVGSDPDPVPVPVGPGSDPDPVSDPGSGPGPVGVPPPPILVATQEQLGPVWFPGLEVFVSLEEVLALGWLHQRLKVSSLYITLLSIAILPNLTDPFSLAFPFLATISKVYAFPDLPVRTTFLAEPVHILSKAV